MSVTFTLSNEEAEELERMLRQHENEMLIEIHRTENAQFRLALQRRHELQQRILACIGEARGVEAA